jgi:hypothetical protein
MNFINRIEGAVFFVDILGFSSLTQNEIKLKDQHYSPWLDKYHQKHDNQIMAAALLSEFREILLNIQNTFPSISISQLSDCAFVWSENVKDIILAANNIMSHCISNGIMCRGGMSYGEIIETTQSNSLGRFIVGKAVTDAAKLESIAKGCRIMITTEVPAALYRYDSAFNEKIYLLFQPFTNPLDYLIYDEFKWYITPFMDDNVEDLRFIDKNKKLDLIESRLLLAGIIRLHPKFYWNSLTPQGRLQLKASINFIAQANDLPLKFNHDYDWTDIVETRSILSLDKLKARLKEEKKSKKPFRLIE